MTDVQDWLQSSSGDARVVATGSSSAPHPTFNVPLQYTDVGIVVLIAGTTSTGCAIQVTGLTSGVEYALNEPGAGLTSVVIPCPVSGAVDPSVSVGILGFTGTISWWVLASSDPLWEYTYGQGVPVTNVPGQVFSVQNQELRVLAVPKSLALTTAPITLIPAPPAGQLTLIKSLQFTGAASAATQVVIRGVSTSTNYMVWNVANGAIPSPAMIPLDWAIGEALDFYVTVGTGISVYVVTEQCYQGFV